jgi:hypothetical protein
VKQSLRLPIVEPILRESKMSEPAHTIEDIKEEMRREMEEEE